MSIVRAVLLGALVVTTWTSPFAATPLERYIIKFAPGAEDAVRGAVAQNQGQIRRTLSTRRLLSAALPPGAVSALRARTDIARVDLDPKRYPQAQDTPYGITLVQADPSQGGLAEAVNTSRKVCIIDTGYDITHPDLPNNDFETLVTGNDECGPGCGPSTPWNVDGHGHGTHVAGTIAGLNNQEGVVGVNGGGALPLHIVKVFNDQGQWVYGSDLIAAIDQCANAQAHVINMSLGGPLPDPDEKFAFDQAYAAGMLPVAAAGNGGNNAFSYPASYDSVMSVAAIDADKDAATFSQYNSQVEIAAPGVVVNSTLPNGSYAAWSGTSMATPHVAGVAALVWGSHDHCTSDQIRAALAATAEDLGGPGRNSSYGYGLVQALDAHTLLYNAGCSGHWPADDGYKTHGQLTNGVAATIDFATRSDEYHYDLIVPPGASDLRIVSYDADPGVNGGTGDADLYVVAPAANQPWPASDIWDCRPYMNGSSETCAETNPADGTWRIMLRAYAAYENVSVRASYIPSGEPGNHYHLPDADLPVAGSVSGSIADLSENDGVMQTITEGSTGGKPRDRTSIAEHHWRIPGVTSGESVTFELIAAGTDSGENDTFSFDISYNNGGTWAALCGAGLTLREGGALQRYECSLPNTTNGTVLLRARDDDRSRGNLNYDVLYVDQLQIVTVNSDEGPVQPPPPPPPTEVVLVSATGEKRRKGKIFVTLEWTGPSEASIHRSIDGSPFSNIDTGSNGSYEDNTGLKGSAVIDYYVCDAVDINNCSDTKTVAF